MRRRNACILIIFLLLLCLGGREGENGEQTGKDFFYEPCTEADDEEKFNDEQDRVMETYAYEIRGGKIHTKKEDNFLWSENRVPIVRIEMLENREKMQRINEMLEQRILETLPMDQPWLDAVEVQITYRSEKYLCFEYISHASLPEGYDSRRLKFTLNLQQEQWEKYPETEEDLQIFDLSNMHIEMVEYLQKSIEDQNLLRGEAGYKIYEMESDYNGVYFSCIQVGGLDEEEKQERINRIFIEPLTVLIGGEGITSEDRKRMQEDFDKMRVYIAYKTNEWISVVYVWPKRARSHIIPDDSIELGVTVNMRTGERYMLDDLFEISGLNDWICMNQRIGMGKWGNSLDTLMDGGRVWKEYQIAEKELEHGYNWFDRLMQGLTNQSFYLYQGKLVLVSTYADCEVALPEIYEFLKVDPWY